MASIVFRVLNKWLNESYHENMISVIGAAPMAKQTASLLTALLGCGGLHSLFLNLHIEKLEACSACGPIPTIVTKSKQDPKK